MYKSVKSDNVGLEVGGAGNKPQPGGGNRGRGQRGDGHGAGPKGLLASMSVENGTRSIGGDNSAARLRRCYIQTAHRAQTRCWTSRAARWDGMGRSNVHSWRPLQEA